MQQPHVQVFVPTDHNRADKNHHALSGTTKAEKIAMPSRACHKALSIADSFQDDPGLALLFEAASFASHPKTRFAQTVGLGRFASSRSSKKL
ncbi:hypothetical protein KKI24_09650, partial [bacterium]|nr:hypothetical protein [bacterium]